MTAALLVVATLSGMRAGELMELRHGCRRTEQTMPGLTRHKLASSLIKGQPVGGTPEEWVVIEPAYLAAGLAEQLTPPADGPAHDQLLFGRFHFNSRYQTFRAFVDGPAGKRLGLAPIPDGPVNLRMLRRSLALELAHRPGGLLATKVQLKHISVATSEGYPARPGGAQAQLLAEINTHETQRNLQLVLAEYRNYQNGVMPAGPGARELTTFFNHIDNTLGEGPEPGGPPKVQHNDRDVLNLLSKRAATLHLGAANYCWFTDPSRALCLTLAGTPAADRPLASMCDSARCPQATHHPRHRQTWADTAAATKVLLDGLGPTRKTEKARLQADHDRASRVIAEIDNATRAAPDIQD
jgi:hypothetical protein